MHFSRQQGRWVSRSGAARPSYPDPHDPHGPAYAERNKVHATELPGGMVRVDIGEPLKRLPSETQPVPSVTRKAPAPVAIAPPPAAPAAAPRVAPKEHRAITRQP